MRGRLLVWAVVLLLFTRAVYLLWEARSGVWPWG
jgi:hypothetical protein